jgi:hypothetical protein
MAAEQRPVMIGAVGKHHVGKADFRGVRSHGELRTA